MTKEIPNIAFNPKNEKHQGFEIVAIDTIARYKVKYEHSPELPHQLKFYMLIFFTEGKGQHFIDFKWYPVQKNSVVYLTKEQINAFQFTKGLQGYCIIFTESYFVNCFAALPKDFVFRVFNPQLFSPVLQVAAHSDFVTYFHLLCSEYEKENVAHQKTILDALFTILISKTEQYKQHQTLYLKQPSKIRRFQEFMVLLHQHFTRHRDATFYAQELQVTYKHLNDICKVLVHKTAKSVIDEYIVLQAKRKLINSSIKSTQLAYSLGFEDPTNFTKYFKNKTGLTPSAFKKAHS